MDFYTTERINQAEDKKFYALHTSHFYVALGRKNFAYYFDF